MSKWKITLIVDVDDDELDRHNGHDLPPPNNVYDWYQTDLIEAIDLGLAEVDHDECYRIDKMTQ